MNYFEIYHRNFEQNPQRHQIPIDFEITTEKLFETLETAGIGMSTTSSPNVIETIFNRKLVYTFHHQNGTNQYYHTHK